MQQKLTYFGTRVSPNQIISKHGYLLCLNVPICRTGTQSYLGSELEGHPGYDPEWGLNPNERYDVLRSLEEVTNPATVASFEGNSVVDDHPNAMVYPGSLVTCENDGVLNRGHGQNIRVGSELDMGETPLLADLHVKSIELIHKIDGGKRDISCGYTFTLKRLPDGTLVMTNIRGNHIAVVTKGRAGDEVAIGDHDLPQTEKKEKKPVKDKRNHLIGLGLMAACAVADADPEEIAAMAKEATKDAAEPKEEPPMKDKAAKDKVAKDKAAKDEDDAMEDADEHPKGCRCDDCKPAAKDKAVKDKAAKDKAAKDAPDLEDLDDVPGEAEIIADGVDPDLEIDNTGKEVLKTALDSSRNLISVLKPIMGSGSMPKAAVDAYNAHVKALNGTKTANPYAALVQVQAPILALDSAIAKPQRNPREFFEGVTHAEGTRKYQEYLATQGGR